MVGWTSVHLEQFIWMGWDTDLVTERLKAWGINSKHRDMIAWNLFDLVKNYQYLCLWVSLLGLSTLVRCRTQKLETSIGWAPPKADLEIRVKVHVVYLVGGRRQEGEKKKSIKGVKMRGYHSGQVGLTLTEDKPCPRISPRGQKAAQLTAKSHPPLAEICPQNIPTFTLQLAPAFSRVSSR